MKIAQKNKLAIQRRKKLCAACISILKMNIQRPILFARPLIEREKIRFYKEKKIKLLFRTLFHFVYVFFSFLCLLQYFPMIYF